MGDLLRACRILAGSIVVAAGLIVAGCQSPGDPDVLESARQPESSAPAATQTFGDGPVRIDMFVDTGLDNNARDYRDGAALAVKMLGASQLKLTVHDLRGKGADAAGLIAGAASGGARFLVGSSSLAGQFANNPAGTASILLGDQPGGSSVAIANDEVGSGIEAVAYAAGAGRKNIMVISTRPLSEGETQRLQAGFRNAGAQLMGIVTDPTSSSGAARLADLGKTQAILLIGAEAPRAVAPTLRQRAGLGADFVFLGTSAWPTNARSHPALEGSLVALIDQNSLERISEPFRAAYGRPLSVEAAYGFDALAVAAGLVRTSGAQGLTQQALHASSGFTGATGSFRFNTQGRVERRLAIYRLSRGRLELLDEAPVGF
jgi:hypothetical protein